MSLGLSFFFCFVIATVNESTIIMAVLFHSSVLKKNPVPTKLAGVQLYVQLKYEFIYFEEKVPLH